MSRWLMFWVVCGSLPGCTSSTPEHGPQDASVDLGADAASVSLDAATSDDAARAEDASTTAELDASTRDAGRTRTCGTLAGLRCAEDEHCVLPSRAAPEAEGVCVPLTFCTYPNDEHACPVGDACYVLTCDDDGLGDCNGYCVPIPQTPAFCGGIAGIACDAGFACVDDPGDDCDPHDGGADCGGICVDPRAPFRVCGGIAGLACPSGHACVDDPRDGCDPAHGGADCGGICVVE